jgi:tetratricopeptide (TPR) repeat protein
LAEIAVHERRWAEAAGYGERIVSLLTESKDAAQQPHPDTGDLATGKLDTRDLATAHFNLAVLLKDSGKPREAIGHFEQALQIRPDSAHAHFKLGVVLQKMGRPPEAISHYEQALRIKPDYADAHLELGVVLQQMGKFPEAISHYEQAVRSKPDYADAHNNLGMALQQTGKVLEAIGQYTEAVRLNPDLPLALNNLAWIRATDGDPRLRHGAEGVRLAEHACQLTGRKDFRLLNTLAAAYAEAQRFPEAVATSQEALALARSAKQAAVADAIQSRVVLYRAGRPYREARLGTPAAGSP